MSRNDNGLVLTEEQLDKFKAKMSEVITEHPKIERISCGVEDLQQYKTSLESSYQVSKVALMFSTVALTYGVLKIDWPVIFVSLSVLAPSVVAFSKLEQERAEYGTNNTIKN